MIGIVEVTLNGSVKQLVFANYALEQYTKLTGSDIGQLKNIDQNYSQLDMVADLCYCGLVGYYRRNKLVVDFTHEDVKCWVDEISLADQLKVIKEFTASVLEMTTQMVTAFKALNAGNTDSTGNEKKK